MSVYKWCKWIEQLQLRYVLSQCPSAAKVGIASAVSVISLHDALLLCLEGVTMLNWPGHCLRHIHICMHLLMKLALNGKMIVYAVQLQV